MSILTVDAFVAAIGETEADNVAGVGPRGERELDQEKLQAALDFADGLILGKLRTRFPEGLPQPTSEILLGIATDFALYRLRYKTGDQSGVQDETYRRYQAALKLLDQVADGEILIGDDDQPVASDPVLVAGEPARAGRILNGWHR